MNTREFEQALRSILQDHTSGSTYISEKIEQIFPFIPEKIFESTVMKILNAHASMASVINRINWLCLKREETRVGETKDESRLTFDTFWRDNRTRQIWITLSMSHWVIECLKRCPGKCRIKAGISYPDREGILTAKKLSGFHEVDIFEDGALCSELETSDGVLLGADLITPRNIVNKTGSFGLALAAKHHKKPFHIISSGDKFLTPPLESFYRMKMQKKGNRTIHYFEEIPREMITRVYLSTEPWNFPLSKTLNKMSGQPRL